MQRPKAIYSSIRRATRRRSIQVMIATAFSLVAIACMVAMGLMLYAQFTENLRQTVLRENQQLVAQVALNINNYTARMRGISNSMYYKVIKKVDLAEQSVARDMGLFYEANNGVLVSVALYTQDGSLVAAAPNATEKENVDVRKQDWFIRANSIIENPHFSTPHVQNLFDESSQRHDYVISLSRMVELTYAGTTSRGVLLVDMNFAGIEMIFRQMMGEATGYVYLIDKAGEIIYHPRQKLIYSGLYSENNVAAAGYADGMYVETFGGGVRQVIVKTCSYTGWKIISVIPNSEFSVSFQQIRVLMVTIVGLAILLMLSMNALVSRRIAKPIKKLDESVRALEQGSLDLEVYIGGPYEIEHLGKTIRKTVTRMRGLMDDIVQAQINPHFLYNTLDSIVWMIEGGRQQEAISMVTALANLFRIALSRGSNIIPIRTEIQYAQHYLHIQNTRYKNKFTVQYDIDPAIEDCYTVKLIVQPILENAIYHAMELMDGDGEITIRGYQKNGDVFIEVRDNGLGMTEEKTRALLTAEARGGPSRGSGIGLLNVHQRICLYYGDAYGLSIESELDVGTTVRIHLPQKWSEDDVPGTQA